VAAHLIAVGVTGHRPWTSGDRALPTRDAAARCVECDAAIGGWGCWYSNGLGELVPFCADCAKREFGDDARTAAA
jgi:hypothetical protein